MAKNTVKVVKVEQAVDGDAYALRAINIAAKADVQVFQNLTIMADAKEITQTGTIPLLFALIASYGEHAQTTDEDGNITENEFPLSIWPNPGVEGGNNPDVFSRKEQNEKGEWVNKKTGFFPEWVRGTPEGKANHEEIKNLKRLLNDKDNRQGIPAELIAKYCDGTAADTKAINARIAKLDNRLKSEVVAVRRSLKMFHKLAAINELPEVQAEFLLDKDGNLEDTPEPIFVFQVKGYDKEGNAVPHPVKQKMFNIGTFLNLDADKAIEGGGTYDALIKTLQRNTNKTPTSEAAPQKIATLDTLEARTNDIAEYWSDIWADKTGEKQAAFWRKLNGAGSDDFLRNIFSLGDIINEIRRKDKLAARVAALEEGAAGKDMVTTAEQEAA